MTLHVIIVFPDKRPADSTLIHSFVPLATGLVDMCHFEKFVTVGTLVCLLLSETDSKNRPGEFSSTAEFETV